MPDSDESKKCENFYVDEFASAVVQFGLILDSLFKQGNEKDLSQVGLSFFFL